MSGMGQDGFYFTSCSNAVADNTLPPSNMFCVVNHGQPNLEDGCYPPAKSVEALKDSGETYDDLYPPACEPGQCLPRRYTSNSNFQSTFTFTALLSAFLLVARYLYQL